MLFVVLHTYIDEAVHGAVPYDASVPIEAACFQFKWLLKRILDCE
jgi:hypothetical protein